MPTQLSDAEGNRPAIGNGEIAVPPRGVVDLMHAEKLNDRNLGDPGQGLLIANKRSICESQNEYDK